MSDIEDAVNAFMNAMKSAKEWDQFPSGNLCEMLRPIERRSFNFKYHNVQVWQDGKCVAEQKGDYSLSAQVHDGVMHVSLHDLRLRDMVFQHFTFGQISENGDRIMWSKDIFNDTGETERNNPDIMSLFYKNGHIARIYIHIHDPALLIELHGTSNCPSPDTHINNRSAADGKYADILAYFERHPLGSEMPVLTLLSTLPPRDRCSILEVIRAKDPSNVEVYNKLSMAYLKNGQESKARELLQEGLETGALDDFTFQQLDEKITFLHANMRVTPEQEAALRAAGAAAPRPSQSYAETIGILSGRYADNASGQFREFYQLLMSLCQQHQSK